MTDIVLHDIDPLLLDRIRRIATTRAWPLAISLDRASRVISDTRWPRWFTNSALSVTVLYQDRRRRTVSPCWLVVNSIHVP